MRGLGDITIDIEPLLQEMVYDHDLQMGEILAIIKAYLEIHCPDCIEEYVDGTRPTYFYGHKEER